MTTIFLFHAFTLFSFLFLTSSSADNKPTTITIPLTPRFTKIRDLYHNLATRAHDIKSGPAIKEPIFPHSYGGHSITLSFGTPPQELSFVVDTGSHVVWFPCTTKYECINCTSSNAPVFDPELSSSSEILSCKSPKCLNSSTLTVPAVCSSCNRKSKNCSLRCPSYILLYGRGITGGHYLLERLKFPEKTFENVLVGCSTISAYQPTTSGIAGLGRTPFSLPIQMGAKKFAYCLNSHDFDDTSRSGKLIFDYRGGNTEGLSYTPLLKNPSRYPVYYYVSLKDIIIGRKPLTVPDKYLAPASDGEGGAIVDNGFALGYMAKPVFELVLTELKTQMAKYKRDVLLEKRTGLPLCYNFSAEMSIEIPEFAFEFTSGAKMVLPLENYLLVDPDLRVCCFIIAIEGENSSRETHLGPSIIIGNYHQMNFYVEFDLENERFGFRKQTC